MIDHQDLSTVASVARVAYSDSAHILARQSLYAYASPAISASDAAIDNLRLESADSLLDVGCGTGSLLIRIAGIFPNLRLTGVDLSSEHIEFARAEAKKLNLKIAFEVADVQSLQFESESFDRVAAIHMLYHAPDIARAVSEIVRVSTKQGLVVITTNGLKTKPALTMLLNDLGSVLSPSELVPTTERFNIDESAHHLQKHFKSVDIIPYHSQLRIPDAEPIVNYFRSTRPLWHPQPTDATWQAALARLDQALIRHFQCQRDFTDENVFGAFIAHGKH